MLKLSALGQKFKVSKSVISEVIYSLIFNLHEILANPWF
jgi:hypothetical protein